MRHHSISLHAMVTAVFCLICISDTIIFPALMALQGKTWTAITMNGPGAAVYYGAWGSILSVSTWRRYRDKDAPAGDK